MAQLTDQEFEAKWNLGFADNTMQDITEKTFRVFKTDLKDSYANLRALNVRQVRGATYPLPYTDSVSQIPPAYRIVGMLALARVGTTAADAATRPTLPGPMSLQLVAAPDGDVEALVDEQPATTATVKAKWVTQPTVNLLTADNDWLGANDFKRGLKLPNAVNFDEYGQLFVRRVDVDARLYLHNGRFSLAKDSLVQWKADDYINQDGDADVGLARSGAGVLEVNTGTKGSPATLSAMDVVFQAAPPALNSGTKLAGALGLLPGLLTTAKTSLVVAINEVLSRLPKPGVGLAQTGNVIGLTKTVKNQSLGASVVGLIADNDGAIVNDNDFAKGYLASGFLPVEAGTSIAFSGGIPQFSAYYDAAQVYLRAVSMYQDPYLNQVPPGAAFVRFSHPKAQYAAFTFTLGRLPYVRTVNNQFPDADGNIFVQASAGPAAPAGVATPSGTQLVFTQDAEYAPIYSGTFTVDVTGAKVGVVVRVELGPAASAPTLPAAQFELVGANVFQAGRRQGFGFVVAASGKMEYFIYPKP